MPTFAPSETSKTLPLTIIIHQCHQCFRRFDPPRNIPIPKADDYFHPECFEIVLGAELANEYDEFVKKYGDTYSSTDELQTKLTLWGGDHRVQAAKFKIWSRIHAERNAREQKEWEEGEAQRARERKFKEQEILEERKIIERNIKQESKKAAEDLKITQARHAMELEELRFAAAIKLRPIPEPIRYEHTHILGPAGSGKTTLLQQIILDDLAKPDPPALVIIDPKGLMIERLSQLQVFESRLRDRLIIIDPTTEPLPALNMFQPPPKGAENQTISNFAYIFAQAGASLTSKMGPPFLFAVRLMFSIEGANLFTLMDLFDDPAKERKFQPHIDRLTDYATKRFFNTDFYAANYSATREQIKSRLYEIIARPEIVEMFNAPDCSLDMFECLQQRKIVLVNTGMLKLGSTGSQLLGRYIISSTLNAAYRRSVIPKAEWHPAYLIIDEFQEFADEDKTPELLRLAREYNLGVVLAHQNMHSNELNDSLRTSISTNTSIKYSSTPEAIDQNYMARDLRCDAQFLKDHTKPGTFACFARGMNLKHPFLVTVPFGAISQQPQSSPEAHRAIVAEAKQRVAGTPRPPATVAPVVAPVAAEPTAPIPPPPATPTPPKAGWFAKLTGRDAPPPPPRVEPAPATVKPPPAPQAAPIPKKRDPNEPATDW